MYWIPRDSFEQRVQVEKIPYDKWYERGLIRLCNGNSINYGDVTAWFLEMVNEGHNPGMDLLRQLQREILGREMEGHG